MIMFLTIEVLEILLRFTTSRTQYNLGLQKEFVITSYSIHYTKLYDGILEIGAQAMIDDAGGKLAFQLDTPDAGATHVFRL